MLRKTGEGNDCGGITRAKIVSPLCTVQLKKSKSCDRVTKYYSMLRKTGEGNDCGGITRAKI